MDDATNWHYELLGLKVVEELQKNLFNAAFYKTTQAVVEELLSTIPQNATIGVAGSWTIQTLGLVELFEARGNTVFYHHKPGLSPEEVLEVRRKQLTCDVFLTSTNAITVDGRLVNTDGIGNRVAAMIFGPRKVIVLVGRNKIVKGIEEAQERIRTIAAPLNSKRLNRPNPCVQEGLCMDCQGPTRICNVTTVLHKRPPQTDLHVWLIGEDLGF